ncbi:hypothetical protein AXW37_07470 [Yersinia ruckeri]|nr:hypothetical protein UGYR_03290 [Yersinia ruckeri]OIX31059.1 hypothetical protein AXW19_06795 [Yersinia ruckeri]OIX31198.1 hypothetical protein AXW20_06805 [Yersinia ruckeri]OIX40471.1 hypothetical protein AXW18_06800 [Yersinia ruckeri]OIX40727.1 hypothetical protein AXW21_06810 [Yersinia ruckeri]
MTFGINTECSPEKNKGNQVGNKVKQSYQFELAAWSFNRPALSWLRGSIRRYRFMMFYFIKKTTMQVKITVSCCFRCGFWRTGLFERRSIALGQSDKRHQATQYLYSIYPVCSKTPSFIARRGIIIRRYSAVIRA